MLPEEIEKYYDGEPNLGDVVFLQNTFEKVSVEGEVTGIRRSIPNRLINQETGYELVLYSEYEITIASVPYWFVIGEDWELTIMKTEMSDRLFPVEHDADGKDNE